MKSFITTAIRSLLHTRTVVSSARARSCVAAKPVSLARTSISFFSTSAESRGRPEISVSVIPKNVNVTEVNPLFLKTFQDTYPREFKKEHLNRLFDPNVIAAELREENTDYLCVKEGRNYIGYAKLRYQGSKAILEKIYLLNEYQGRGLGKKLLQACSEHALKKGQKNMELFVAEGNTKAIEFYKEWGFYSAGTTEKEFGGKTVKGIIMRLNDIYTLNQRLAIPDFRYGIYLH